MSKVSISGNSLGTGTFTLASPNSNTDRTLTLPDETGTVVSTASTPTFTGAVTAPSFIPNGSTVPSNGVYLPAANTIAWSTGSTERMRIDSSGNVGIGTSSPTNKFEVRATTNGNLITGVYNDSTGASSNAYIQIYAGGRYVNLSVNYTSQYFQNSGISLTTYYQDYDTQIFRKNDGTERMRITSAGEVLVAGNTDNGAYNLQCNGTGVWGAGAYTNGSDARIKEDIAPIDSGLDVVEKLNPVTYRYKESWTKDQSTQTGFIAQELLVALEGKNYVDGVVQQGGSEGYYSVAYQNIIPILTKAIQELKAELDDTKARLAALEATK